MTQHNTLTDFRSAAKADIPLLSFLDGVESNDSQGTISVCQNYIILGYQLRKRDILCKNDAQEQNYSYHNRVWPGYTDLSLVYIGSHMLYVLQALRLCPFQLL